MVQSSKKTADPQTQVPHLEFERPTSHYHQNETFAVVMLPSQHGSFEVKCEPLKKAKTSTLTIQGNRVLINTDFEPGTYFLKARWRAQGDSSWSDWSSPLYFTIHEKTEDLWSIWEADHRLNSMLEKSIGGALTLTDPDALPPAASGLKHAKWFATPVYEGATPLVNEEQEYYEDPYTYYFANIDTLIAKNAKFITWHDILEGNHRQAPLEIVLQFDIDGGPLSMKRIYQGLISRNIKATLMLHRRGHYWYPYELEDYGLDWVHDAESRGWAIGYHNNALSQVMGSDSKDPDQKKIEEATKAFENDVHFLREHFDIRTYTHHGGNVYNLDVKPSNELFITGVDRSLSPDLWSSIDSMFSDGGFTSRPTTLRNKISSLSSGLHFFRNHPFKYANYQSPVDVPPRFINDLYKVYLPQNPETLDWQRNELDKETEWLHHRQASRFKTRLSYLRLEKPISSSFKPYEKIERYIKELRDKRRISFLKLYPWAEADPRVFWWRMIDCWAPKTGSILNVGALPPEQKNELTRFLSNEVTLSDIDIDETRYSDYLMDICDAPAWMFNSFSATLLFGLPYFSSPSKAVSACYRVTKLGGTGLFGFAADSHPARGSTWHPDTRHLWEKHKEPLENIGLKNNLWAFDEASIKKLFTDWQEVKVEFMGHYWFVVAKKDA